MINLRQKGIIIDGSYPGTLILEGVKAGLVKYRGNEPNFFEDLKKFLEDLKRKDIKKDGRRRENHVLEMLLLYEKCYVLEGSFPPFEFDQMVEEDLIEVIPVPANRQYVKEFNQETLSDILFLKDFIEMYTSHMYISSRSIRANDDKNDIKETVEIGLAFLEAFLHISKQQSSLQDMYNDFKNFYKKQKLGNIMNLYPLLLISAYSVIKNLLKVSGNLGLPVITDDFKITPCLPKFLIQKKIHKIEDTDESLLWKAYRIYLNEIEVVPKIESLEDVLRLRGDSKITAFRQILREWAQKIQLGDLKAEQEIRKDLRKANQELRRIGKWEKIGKWITYLSLPVEIASNLAQLSGGLILAPIGLGIQLYTDVWEWRHKWLLFSR